MSFYASTCDYLALRNDETNKDTAIRIYKSINLSVFPILLVIIIINDTARRILDGLKSNRGGKRSIA